MIPWCRERAIAIMAYTPLEQGRILGNRTLIEVAARHGVRAFPHLRELIEESDAISVAVPTVDHHRVARALLEAGADPNAVSCRGAPPRNGICHNSNRCGPMRFR